MVDKSDVITLDKARECPECGHVGAIALTRPIQGGSLHTIRCVNPICPWYDTDWFVETNSDGEVQVNEKAMKAAQAQKLVAPHDPEFDNIHAQIHRQLGQQLNEESGRQ